MMEMALAMPVLVLLLCGILDFGLVLADVHAVRQGTGNSARQISVDGFGDDSSCIYPPGHEGPSQSQFAAAAATCHVRQQVGLEGDLLVKIVAPDPYVVGEPVALCVQYPMRSVTGLFSNLLDDHWIEVEVDVRVEFFEEPIESYEDDLVGTASWDFCS